MKVYLADRSYDDCRPTCFSAGNDDRFLMKRTTHSMPLGKKRKLGNGPRVGRVIGNGCPVNVLRPILRRRCETCLVNFEFRMSFRFLS